MPIVRDDFKPNEKKQIKMESENHAVLIATKNGNFFVKFERDYDSGMFFDKEACEDAIEFFKRLIEIYDAEEKD